MHVLRRNRPAPRDIPTTLMRTSILTALVCVAGFVPTALASTPQPLSAPLTLTAGEGWVEDFDAAVALAKKENKDLFVDFTGSDWCGWCIKLNDEVFKHEEFLTAAKRSFILVSLDFPRSPEVLAKVPNPARNKELSQKYGIQGFPTILLMTPDGDVFGKTGYRPGGPTPYVEHLNELLTKGKAEVAEASKLVSGWEGAAADAKGAAWDKLADAAEKMSPDSVGAGKLAGALRSAFKDDPTNAAGRKLRATKLLVRFDSIDADVFAAAVELDPKNEDGVHEQAVAGRFQDQSWFEDADTVRRMVEAAERLDATGKMHDKERVVMALAFSAFLTKDTLGDADRAKKIAARVKAIGSSNQRLIGAMDELINS